MNRIVRWALGVALVLVLLLASTALALQHWVGTEDFRSRLEQQTSAALGMGVQISAVTVDLWPLPAVALDRVQVRSRPAVTLERIEARPVWTGLLRGRLDISTLLVRHAVVPAQGVAMIAAAMSPPKGGAAKPTGRNPAASLTVLPRRVVFDDVTWVDAKGAATTVDGQARLDDDGLPETAQLRVRNGPFAGANASLQRQADQWALRMEVGGGTAIGKLQLRAQVGGGWLLQGQVDTSNVEMAAFTAPSRTLTGRLEAHTTLHAELRELGTLSEVLQTQTRFTVHNAVIHGVDLAQAVKAVGMSRGGETRLETLAGQVATHGRAVQLTNLVATSGPLSASGNVAIAPNRSLSGRVTVDVASAAAGGAVGVPLVVGGTLDSPTVQLTRGALIGAAIGTAIAPGAGTGAGLTLGDRIGRMFGK